jgi:hypothetical protein
MTQTLATLLAASAIALGTMGSVHAVAASAGGAYAVPRWTIDGGGGKASSGVFVIQGTIGQPDADPLQPSTGGAYGVTGGYWAVPGPGEPQDAVFADGFE